MRNKVVVIGIGKLGSAIASNASLKGDDVIAVDKDPKSFSKLPVTFSGMEQEGDVLNSRILESLKLRNAKEVTVTTNDDNVNLFVGSAVAKLYEVPTVFVRLNDVEKSQLINDKRVKFLFPFSLTFEDYKKKKNKEK